jgi:hypothetical protein
VKSRRSRAGRGIHTGVVVLATTLGLAPAPAYATATSPVLEFVIPSNGFPVSFTADGGEVTAEMAGFDTVVHCTGSHGEGEILGPRSTVSSYVFTGCETQGGTDGGRKCKTEDANAEEITASLVEAELVDIDQARHEVGMLLNPHGGVYMKFECGGEEVEARGPFLAPVGPINEESASFTASLSRSGAMQTPDEYENSIGEKRPAIPMGKRGTNPLVTTGVELGFRVIPSVPLEIRSVTAQEIEAKQREEEAATAAAAKKRQEEEAATAKNLQAEGQAKPKSLTRAQLLAKALKQCKKTRAKHKRMQCEKLAKKKYGPRRSKSL